MKTEARALMLVSLGIYTHILFCNNTKKHHIVLFQLKIKRKDITLKQKKEKKHGKK